MLAQALLPWVLGRAIDDGVGTGDTQALLAWAGALLGLGVVQAVAGTLRHRVAVSNWLQSSYRMIQVVAHHAALTGAAVRTRLTTGEVVATVSNDALRAGGAFDITARLAGAIASYFVVAAILLSASTLLGLVVLRRRPGPRREPVDGDPAAAGAAARAARAGRPADGGRGRHGRRPAGAARHRRRAGLPRPVPQALGGGPPGRRPGRAAPGDARLRAGAPARRLRRRRHRARRAARDRGDDQRRASSSRSTATPPSS